MQMGDDDAKVIESVFICMATVKAFLPGRKTRTETFFTHTHKITPTHPHKLTFSECRS